MNSVIETLVTRTSCRSYTAEMPTREEIETICMAGSHAPTGMNTQCPIIIAVTNKALRDRMSRLNAQVMGTDTDPFYGAPVVLVVLADKTKGVTPVEDGSLVLGNMMNAAHALGLGSCWINRAREVFAMDEGKAILKELGIEGDYIGVGNCIVGHRATPAAAPRPRKEGWVRWVE